MPSPMNRNTYLGFVVSFFSVVLTVVLMSDFRTGVEDVPELFSAGLRSFADIGMWLFYLPAQVLITLSGRKN